MVNFSFIPNKVVPRTETKILLKVLGKIAEDSSYLYKMLDVLWDIIVLLFSCKWWILKMLLLMHKVSVFSMEKSNFVLEVCISYTLNHSFNFES